MCIISVYYKEIALVVLERYYKFNYKLRETTLALKVVFYKASLRYLITNL